MAHGKGYTPLHTVTGGMLQVAVRKPGKVADAKVTLVVYFTRERQLESLLPASPNYLLERAQLSDAQHGMRLTLTPEGVIRIVQATYDTSVTHAVAGALHMFSLTPREAAMTAVQRLTRSEVYVVLGSLLLADNLARWA